MASGKSLELKAFDEAMSAKNREKRLCVACDKTWDQHLKKDGTRMKKYEGDTHGVAGYPGQTRRVK